MHILNISILVDGSNAITSPSIFCLKHVVQATILPIEKHSLTPAILHFSHDFSDYALRYQSSENVFDDLRLVTIFVVFILIARPKIDVVICSQD